MSSTEGHAEFQEQLFAIKKKRTSTALFTFVSIISTLELLFACFAVGAYFGPGPLKAIEIAIGVGAAFVVGFPVALLVTRKRLERGALFKAVFFEGRHAVRTAIFPDYLLLGPEIVLRGLVSSIEAEKDALVLRYQDPRYGGVVLRELAGDAAARERLASLLQELGRPSVGLG